MRYRLSGFLKGVMKKRLLAGLGVLVLSSHSLGAQTLSIDHQPVGCAAAEKFPRLTARFAPADTIATARVLFQGANTLEWYSVAMKPEGPVYSGVLPKPKKSLKAFRYYIEVTDKALEVNRTAEYTTSVIASAGECKGRLMAGTLGSASVVLHGPAGAAVLPAGFASNGVVAAGSSTGSATGAAGATAAAGAGAAAAAGGGLSGGALIGIVAGAGAAAAGVAVAAGKGGENTSPSGSTPTPTPTPSTSYTGPFAGQRTTQHTYDPPSTGGCQTVTRTLSGTIRVTLDQASGGASTGTATTTGTFTVIANTGNCIAVGNRPGDTSGINHTVAVTGSPGNLVFRQTQSSETIDFSGALSGGVIVGTVTFTHTITSSSGNQNGAVSIPVTLR